MKSRVPTLLIKNNNNNYYYKLKGKNQFLIL